MIGKKNKKKVFELFREIHEIHFVTGELEIVIGVFLDRLRKAHDTLMLKGPLCSFDELGQHSAGAVATFSSLQNELSAIIGYTMYLFNHCGSILLDTGWPPLDGDAELDTLATCLVSDYVVLCLRDAGNIRDLAAPTSPEQTF